MDSTNEEGNPELDKLGFRRCLGQYATGVTVISTSEAGNPAGLTCNSFSSLSLDPPLISWALRRESQSFSAFANCSHFAVSVLAVDQIDVSQRISKPGPGWLFVTLQTGWAIRCRNVLAPEAQVALSVQARF